tara:strand:+ start:6146 stop:6790 length:645 start_codon:yes stop_codon:yes gene_type:complete
MLLPIPQLLEYFEINVKGVIQIGAHYGQEYHPLKAYGVNNFVMIEPVPRHFQEMKQSINDDTVLMFQTALGSEIKMVEMNISDFEGQDAELYKGMSSSILTPKKHIQQYPHIKFKEKIEVEMTTLDSLFEKENIDAKQYNMINMDVQGYELEVLRGAENTLNSIDCVYTEVNRDEVYEGCPMIEEIDDFLSNYGLKRAVVNWAGDTWGDAVYVK